MSTGASANPGAEPQLRVNFLMRVGSSLCVLALLVYGIFFAPVWFFSLGTAAFIIAGLYEFFAMLRKKGAIEYGVFGMLVGAVIPFVVHLQLGSGRSGEVLFIVLACFGLFLLQFARKDNPYALEGISITFFGIMYISWFLSFAIKLRFLDGGEWLIAYALVVTKSSDIGAYCIGMPLGRRLLIRHISPKKTVEGTLGGLLVAGLVSMLFASVLPFSINIYGLFLLGALIAAIGQSGDLAESLIKRYCGVKDSGSRIPGFGGVLDMMDSVLFTTPLFYFYVQTVYY